MSTTTVPLLVTGAAELAALPAAAPELAAGEPPAEAADEADEADELELPVVLLLLQAATLTTKVAARAPAVNLRMRI